MKLRLIQVGMGGWGRSWAKNVVAQNQDVELIACVDPLPAMLELAQKEQVHTNMYFSSFAEAVATVEAEAVLITTSLPGHVPVTLEALNAGKHVLLEKPFAPTVAEAQQVVERAEQHRCTLMISQNYRYHPAVQLVQKLIQDEKLGPVGTVNVDFRRYANSAPRESQANYHFWQPLLVDMAIHHFDLMRMMLAQEPTHITCQTWNPSWSKFDGDAVGSATITFDGGVMVNYRGSWVSAQPQTNWAGEWHIECEGGEIMVTSRGEKPDAVSVRLLGKRTRLLKLPDVPLLDRSGTLAAFIQAVRSGKEPETSGRRNLKTLALTLAAVEAAMTGLPVAIAAE